MPITTVLTEAVPDLLEEGGALRAAGQPEAAIAAYRKLIEQEPERAEAHHQLGNVLKALRRYAEAAASLRVAARLAPGAAAVWLNLGVACLELNRADEAVTCFRRAIRLEPGRPEAHNVLGHALLTQGRSTAARRSLDEAIRLRAGYPAAYDNLGRALKAQGRAAEAVVAHRRALAGAPTPQTHSNLLYTLNFPEGIAPAEIAAEHRRWAADHAAAWPVNGPAVAPARGHRLRLGFVSPDFVHHAVAYFFEPVLAARDPTAFEVFCYSDAPVPDATTDRLRGHADHWRDIAGWNDERVAQLIREDRIDLLVDLAGHTARNRLLVFARKPAPVQATWLGYPNTTGLGAIDFRVTEDISDPPGQTEAWHSEKLWRLPGPFSCYAPPPESPPVGPLPALAAGHVTFGCFNHLAKVNPGLIALWAAVLRATADSRLLLKSRGLADAETVARLREEFGREGIEPARIDCNGAELSVARHLALYHGVDIALDTFPYNGTTTTCEALWMGVPVVTRLGATHVSRVGGSLLTHLGAAEWTAATPEAYALRCAELAADLPKLALIRASLRERMRQSPLCDAAGFTRQLEGAFRAMCQPSGGRGA